MGQQFSNQIDEWKKELSNRMKRSLRTELEDFLTGVLARDGKSLNKNQQRKRKKKLVERQ